MPNYSYKNLTAENYKFNNLDLNVLFPANNPLSENVRKWMGSNTLDQCNGKLIDYLGSLEEEAKKHADPGDHFDAFRKLFLKCTAAAATMKQVTDPNAGISEKSRETNWNKCREVLSSNIDTLQKALDNYNRNTNYSHLMDSQMQAVLGLVRGMRQINTDINRFAEQADSNKTYEQKEKAMNQLKKQNTEVEKQFIALQTAAEKQNINLKTMDQDLDYIQKNLPSTEKDMEQYKRMLEQAPDKIKFAKNQFIKSEEKKYCLAGYGVAYLEKKQYEKEHPLPNAEELNQQIAALESTLPDGWKEKEEDIFMAAQRLTDCENILKEVTALNAAKNEDISTIESHNLLLENTDPCFWWSKKDKLNNEAINYHTDYIARIQEKVNAAREDFKCAIGLSGEDEKIQKELQEKRASAGKLKDILELKKQLSSIDDIRAEYEWKDNKLAEAESHLKLYLKKYTPDKDPEKVIRTCKANLEKGTVKLKDLENMFYNAQANLSPTSCMKTEKAGYKQMEEEKSILETIVEHQEDQIRQMEKEKKNIEALKNEVKGFTEKQRNFSAHSKNFLKTYIDEKNKFAHDERVNNIRISLHDMLNRFDTCKKDGHTNSTAYTKLKTVLENLTKPNTKLTDQMLDQAVQVSQEYLTAKQSGVHVRGFWTHPMRYYRIAFANDLKQLALNAKETMKDVARDQAHLTQMKETADVLTSGLKNMAKFKNPEEKSLKSRLEDREKFITRMKGEAKELHIEIPGPGDKVPAAPMILGI